MREQLSKDARRMIQENKLPVQLCFSDGSRLSGIGQVNYPAPAAALDTSGNIVDKRMSVSISLYDFERYPLDDTEHGDYYENVRVNVPVAPFSGAELKNYRIDDAPQGGLGLNTMLIFLTDVDPNADTISIDD